MCRPDLISSKPTAVRGTDSGVPGVSYSSSEGEEEWSIHSPLDINSRMDLLTTKMETVSSTKMTSNPLPSSIGAISLAAGMLGFGLWLPFSLDPVAAKHIYQFSHYTYDEKFSLFDNSPWTYGTDYALAVIMTILGLSILKCSRRGISDQLCRRASSLLVLYMISVTAGGLAHQHYTTVESRNTLGFRLLWTLCVGTVSLANTSMGLSGTEIVRKFQTERLCKASFHKVPFVPQTVWWVYGLCCTAFTAWGGMSFQRPACDIFIAGATQTPPTFYIMTALFYLDRVSLRARIMGMIGFIMNAPLLPIYTLLVHYLKWSLPSINTLLHCWLCVAWSMQGYSLRAVVKTLIAEEDTKGRRPTL